MPHDISLPTNRRDQPANSSSICFQRRSQQKKNPPAEAGGRRGDLWLWYFDVAYSDIVAVEEIFVDIVCDDFRILEKQFVVIAIKSISKS